MGSGIEKLSALVSNFMPLFFNASRLNFSMSGLRENFWLVFVVHDLVEHQVLMSQVFLTNENLASLGWISIEKPLVARHVHKDPVL